MAEQGQIILFDADALIRLWGYGANYLSKLCRNTDIFVSPTVLDEVKGATNQAGRWKRFPREKIGSEGYPKLLNLDELDEKQYADYSAYFQVLRGADPGERETFSIAWALGWDVCSYDREAEALWREHKPPDVSSRHLYLMDILRKHKVL